MNFKDATRRFYSWLASVFLRLHRYEAAASMYEKVLRRHQDDRYVQLQRVSCLLHVPQRRADAIVRLQSLLQVSPSASGFYLLACELQQDARHVEALTAFQETARLENPPPADFDYNRALNLTALGRLEEAAEAFADAAHLNPSDAQAWGNLGATLVGLGRSKEAVSCLERAMRLSPKPRFGFNLAATLYHLNRLEEAEHVLRDARVLDAHAVDAMDLLAQIVAERGRAEEAITLARAICAQNAGLLSSRLALSSVLLETNRLDEAIAEANAAIGMAPTDPRPYGALGGIYIRSKDGDRALAAFERMSGYLGPSIEHRLSPDQVVCAAGRGAALSLLGRHDEAMVAFDEVLGANPEFLERSAELAGHHQRSLQGVSENKRSVPFKNPSDTLGHQ